MLNIVFIGCALYALTRLLASCRDFFKFGGKAWQFAGLLVLSLLSMGLHAVLILPVLPPQVTIYPLPLPAIAYAALALLSWRCAYIFDTSGTALAAKAQHACNAMLAAAGVALVIAGMNWILAWFQIAMTRGP